MALKEICEICKKTIRKNSKTVCCNICNQKVHIDCNHISRTLYNSLTEADNTSLFYCSPCLNSLLPFGLETDQSFSQTNTMGLNKDSKLENHAFNISKNDQKTITQLSRLILENTDPNNENVNFCKYYQIDDFTKRKFNKIDSFSLLHLNINSLQFHKNDLDILLDSLNLDFDIITISETRLLKNIQPTHDISLPNYDIDYTPTEACKGGTLIYTTKRMHHIPRKDLEIYEANKVFIEIY